jgi:Xaa-Pro aminopeptidase
VIAPASDFSRIQQQLPEIQQSLRQQGLDGWLLYDLRARNLIAGGLLGLGEMSRRWFVLLPATGTPLAITHGIEQGPWRQWPWLKTSYVSWRSLDDALRSALAGRGRIAMEISPRDAVPVGDVVPSGVIELVRAAGADVVTSGDLISRFYSRWSETQLAGHHVAAAALAEVAEETFSRLAADVAAGRNPTETEVRGRVVAALTARGCPIADCIAATSYNAANPHYEPVNGGATFRAGQVVLLDLWGKQSDDAVWADQTWMACLGAQVPERAATLFAIVLRARDAAVQFLQQSWQAGREVRGWEVDDVARAVINSAGYGDYFIHRTGHSIDVATHGMGPNIDNLETHETRVLLPGVGFSIEPGIYIPGEIGLRSEINVFMSPDGPLVTPPRIQHAMATT